MKRARPSRRAQLGSRAAGLAALALGVLSALGWQARRASANREMPLWIHRASGSIQVEYTRSVMARSREIGEPPTGPPRHGRYAARGARQ